MNHISLTYIYVYSVKSGNKFLDQFMDQVVKKESGGGSFRYLMEDIVKVLKDSIEGTHYHYK